MTFENTDMQHERFYSPSQVALGTLIAGPVLGCWFISRNYQLIGDKLRAKRFLILGFCSILMITFLIFWIPEDSQDRLPNFLISVISTVFTYGYVKHIQCKFLQKFYEQGYRKQTYLRCIIYSICALILLFIYGVLIVSVH